MIASLPMYDRPETRAANERLWAGVRDEVRLLWKDVPDVAIKPPVSLEHDGDVWRHWRAPDLFLSQTCGLPYATELYEKVTLLGTPDYGLPGCPPGHYNSVLVTRPSEDRDWSELTLAINSACSQSGFGAPMNHAARLGTRFGGVLETGAHRNSATAIAEGRADIAAIDAHTWRMITRWDTVADALVEVGRTEPTPGLPLITALRERTDDIHFALSHHLSTLSDADRDVLGIKGLTFISRDKYLAVPVPEPLQSA